MTGRDALREKLKEMGFSPVQTKSKLVEAMLCIFADPDNSISAYEALRQTHKELDNKILEHSNETMKASGVAREYEAKLALLENRNKKLKTLKDQLLAFETAEARDKARLAFLYRDISYRPENGWQKTEYIKALGAILGGGYADAEPTYDYDNFSDFNESQKRKERL